MKLSPAQLRALERMGERKDQLLVNYGAACGVKRASVLKLHALGLAIYMLAEKGVSCRITGAGRAHLAALQQTGHRSS